MKAHFISDLIDYDGSQLRSFWIDEQTHMAGDGIVAFVGAAHVGEKHMVDLEDRANGAWIHSDRMLHFIIEHCQYNLAMAIAMQRLFVSIVAEEIRAQAPAATIVRSGNDLHDGSAKLSVSVATTSPRSSLIHLGINILHSNTPVQTKGLADYGIEPEAFGRSLMERYIHEVTGVHHASTKVRQVP
jgi:uncharacterized protein